MISVILNEDNISEDIAIINDKADINHLKNSFRVKENDIIRGVDGKYEYILEVINVEKKEISCKIIEKNQDRFSNLVEIDAGISLLKNDKMDLTIQKLTEIGINKILPISTKRGVVKLKEKKDKWDVIVREAMKQCQAVKPTLIDDIIKLENINFDSYDLVIVPYEAHEKDTIKNLLKDIEDYKKINKILYIIGPEGGFDPSEIEFLKNKACKIVTLGKRILRAETASIVVGGILVNEFE